jgi:hypothetical protein
MSAPSNRQNSELNWLPELLTSVTVLTHALGADPKIPYNFEELVETMLTNEAATEMPRWFAPLTSAQTYKSSMLDVPIKVASAPWGVLHRRSRLWKRVLVPAERAVSRHMRKV